MLITELKTNVIVRGPVLPEPVQVIATEVKRIAGFIPKTCWIAHVKSELGLTTRIAPNRIHAGKRKYPCPPERRQVIVETIRRLRAIR